MANLIEARTGAEQHSSYWGKFFVHGLDLVVEDYHRSRHESYRDGALEVADGILFTVWATEGNKYGTQDSNYYICVSDSAAAPQTIQGGCYGRGGWITGRFRIVAHGAGKTRAPRLLAWVKAVGGIERLSMDLAEHFAEYINRRGVALPPKLQKS